MFAAFGERGFYSGSTYKPRHRNAAHRHAFLEAGRLHYDENLNKQLKYIGRLYAMP